MIKTPRSQWRGHGSIPGWGNKILQEAGYSQKTTTTTKKLQCESVKEHKFKFMCFLHSKAKQTKTLKLGTKKCLLQGHRKRWVAPAPQTPNSQKGFSKAILKASEAGVRLVIADFLVQEFFVLAEVREGQVMKFP